MGDLQLDFSPIVMPHLQASHCVCWEAMALLRVLIIDIYLRNKGIRHRIIRNASVWCLCSQQAVSVYLRMKETSGFS